ncbi:MAG: hypothetical protein IPM95_07200 [Sphingobacteriales bacterium]|nr:hypothetical protein [Sphingobacteriales bacterium]
MKFTKEIILSVLFAAAIIFAASCNRNTGKNVGDGCGTWSKAKTSDSLKVKDGI